MPRESKRAKRERATAIHDLLGQAHPEAKCALIHRNPLELLVSTILSAQCTDVRVNKVTPALFRQFRTAKSFAESPPGELEHFIRSTGFYNNKAKNIRGACRKIVDEFGEKVPRTMEKLLTLPGVARKTAGVVLGVAYGQADGVVVDTHVGRISRHLDLTREQNPNKVEQNLMDLLDRSQWIDFSHRMIWHGRKYCKARKPACSQCPILPLCPGGLARKSP